MHVSRVLQVAYCNESSQHELVDVHTGRMREVENKGKTKSVRTSVQILLICMCNKKREIHKYQQNEINIHSVLHTMQFTGGGVGVGMALIFMANRICNWRKLVSISSNCELR